MFFAKTGKQITLYVKQTTEQLQEKSVSQYQPGLDAKWQPLEKTGLRAFY